MIYISSFGDWFVLSISQFAHACKSRKRDVHAFLVQLIPVFMIIEREYCAYLQSENAQPPRFPAVQCAQLGDRLDITCECTNFHTASTSNALLYDCLNIVQTMNPCCMHSFLLFVQRMKSYPIKSNSNQ